MKGLQGNGFLPIIAQAIAEMEESHGEFANIDFIKRASPPAWNLSADNKGALYSLAHEAVNGNPRLKEPLYLYALATGREHTLMKAVKGTALETEYGSMKSRYSFTDMVKAFQMVPCDLPEGYQKVWRSYQSAAGAYERDSRVKDLLRLRILDLQKEKKISTYRICKDLRLNNANVNAWLKNGEGRKISLPVARKVLEYIEP